VVEFIIACLIRNFNTDNEKPGLVWSGRLKINTSLNNQSCDKLPGADRKFMATARPITAAAWEAAA
jgi:hypothetical protein